MTGRRAFLGQLAAGSVAAAWPRLGQAPAVRRVTAGKPTDVRIEDVTFAYEDHRYRTPIKFGGTLPIA